jgi:hypothetical protein
MSNYQEGGGPYPEGTPSGGAPYQEPTAGGSTAYQGGSQGAASHYETSQFGSPGGQQHWEQQPGYQGQGNQGQGNQGQGPQGQGFFQGGRPLSSHGRPNVQVRTTFKTTEFWVLVVVSLALLIAAAVTDQGADSQSFGAQDAWKYVTWLSIAYILSRGFTKFAGHERDRRNEHSDRR